jgi:hypothetical protein
MTGRSVLRVRNAFPAGQVLPPLTTPKSEDRPWVKVAIEWDDGRTSDTFGHAVRWTAQAVEVAFTGPDGLGRLEWFRTDIVQPREPNR